jgi:hypothetical protein
MKVYASNTDIATFGGSSIGVILIGSFAGYSNYGDILQLLSTIDFYKTQFPNGRIAIVLEVEARQTWHQNLPAYVTNRVIPIFTVSNETNDQNEAMLNEWSDQFVFPPAVVLHFYGGGYITDEWGSRKRLAGEHLLNLCKQAAVKTHIYFSGIQILSGSEDRHWRGLLSRAEVIGVRDVISLDRCKEILGEACEHRPILQGDDALPAIARMIQSVGQPSKPSIGIHVSNAYYTTGDPLARFETLAAVAEAAISNLGHGGELINLIAYKDNHIDESIQARDFQKYFNERNANATDSWSFSCISLLESLSLNSLTMPFDLVISCSYHVAFTALVSLIPVIFIVDVPYYDQKAMGLLNHFGSDYLSIVKPGTDVRTTLSNLLRDAPRASWSLGVGKQWLGLTEVRDTITSSMYKLYSGCTEEEQRKIIAEYRDGAQALAELRRRLILMERHEANLEAEIALLKRRPFLIAPKKEVHKIRREWRKLRERLGLRKAKAASLQR